MGCRPPAAWEIGRFGGIGEGADQNIGGDRTSSVPVGEQPMLVVMVLGLPHPAKALVDWPRDRNNPLLVALADNPQDATCLVDGRNRKIGGLADPQAAGVDQAEAAPMDGIVHAAENALNLGMGERLR